MDNKTKFYRCTMLFQFFPIALLGIFLYSKFQKQEILNIPEMHPNEFIIGSSFPVLFFIGCCIFSIPYLFSKQSIEENHELQMQKKLRQKNFWKFAFYSNVALLVIFLLFLAFVNFQHKREFIIAGDEIIYLFIFFQALFVVLASLILASFMLAAGVYWKTNKTLAIIILTLGFSFFGTWVALEYLFLSEFKRMSEYYYVEEIPLENEAEVVEVPFEESDYPQGDSSEDRGESVEIEEAWNHFINNKYDLKGKQEFTEIRFPMYSNFLENTENDGDYFLTGYVDEIRKDPAMISLAFQMYKTVLYSSVSRRTYRISNFDKVIDGLLFTYDDLMSDESAGNMQKIYKIMAAKREGYDLDAGEYYAQLEKYFTPETIDLLENTRLSNGSQFSNGDIVWFYSFWARRNHENNIEEVVSALKEIKEYYN